MTNPRHRWMMIPVALIACLLLGWYPFMVVASAIVVLSCLLTVVIRAKERRPGEAWMAWLARTARDVAHRPNSTAGLHAVLLSCAHRGWIQSHEAPKPGAAAYCCHRRFGPADEVEVVEVGVEIYGFYPTVVRLKEAQPAK